MLLYRAAEDAFYDWDTGAPHAGPVDRAALFQWHGILTDPVWWRSVWNTALFTVVSVGLEVALGLVIALALHAHMPGRGLVRAAILIPWAIPTVVSAQMWGWMLHDQVGVVNEILLGLGLIGERLAWTADDATAIWAVVAVDVWKTTPFMALLLLAALQMLPEEVFEAGRLDGVHPLKMFWRVTLPLIRPALMVAVIFRLLDALRVFDLFYLLTSNSDRTLAMSVYARREMIEFQDLGRGSAAATLVFLVIAGFTAAYVALGRMTLEPER
ncbi:MAG: sugar ABC transporter permease [Rhodospirillaceae bacterium]|nr:sugar ABC transporter permease [Rhodospirillaceae bacterium]